MASGSIEWRKIPELHEIPDLDDAKIACLADMRDVLERHGFLDVFSVQLVHRHFEMADDEVLIEVQDTEAREQQISVAKRSEIGDARPTGWLFEKGPGLNMTAAVYCVCVADPVRGEACIRHGKSQSPTPAYQKEDAVLQRRIAEDKAKHEQGFPVAGHDPRDKGRTRGR